MATSKRKRRAKPAKCKRCGSDFAMLTEHQRAELHEQLWAVLHGRIDWVPPSDDATPEAGPPYVIGYARAYIDRLVAADQGLCINCVDHIERPAS